MDLLILHSFPDLFTSREGDIAAVLNVIDSRVSVDHNNMLDMRFTKEEVTQALFSMHPDKSFGPNAMNPAFLKSFWQTVGKDRYCLFLYFFFLENCMFPLGLNDTTIVLIPKIDGPEFITDMRPITLFNVIYKVEAKTLANKLKLVLPYIISDSQSAFIGGSS